jgi:hypothetical protein
LCELAGHHISASRQTTNEKLRTRQQYQPIDTYWTSLLPMEASVEQSLQTEHLRSTVVAYLQHSIHTPCSCNMHAPTGTGSLTGLVDFITHIFLGAYHTFRQIAFFYFQPPSFCFPPQDKKHGDQSYFNSHFFPTVQTVSTSKQGTEKQSP